MKRFYMMLFLAILGIGIAVGAIYYGNQPKGAETKPLLKMQTPFKSFVAANGIIEAASTNIPLGTPVSGVVTELFVKAGDSIMIGDPLFVVDTREIEAKVLVAKAKLKEAEAVVVKQKDEYQIANHLKKLNPNAISKKEYLAKKDNLAIAKADAALAQAQLFAFEKTLKLHTVKAMINGRILQCRLRVGAYVDNTSPTMILGSDKMNLRININEYDVFRIKPGAKAVAYIRGHPDLMVPLEYNYTEPYIIPKTTLTGSGTERTDTRVLQVVYSLDAGDFPLYTGQLMDVFIKTPENRKK